METKTPNIPNSEIPNQDWFLPAIASTGNVGQCFDDVVKDLETKKAFIDSLKKAIWKNNKDNIDEISLLARQVKELENTLRFRLGLLRVDQEGSWFRKALHKDYGPFKSSMLLDPIFASYAKKDMPIIRRKLAEAWEKKEENPKIFHPNEPCLWLTLLAFSSKIENLARLSPPFAHLRLDQLPDNLESSLESKALRAFLLNVKQEIFAIRERLKICYDQLYNASEKFWQSQKLSLEKEAASNSRGPQRKTKTHGPKTDRDSRTQNEQSNHNFEPELPNKFIYNFATMEALRFMGFRKIPEASMLRKRYLELAKKLHPDLGGSEESFKMLSKAYQELNQVHEK